MNKQLEAKQEAITKLQVQMQAEFDAHKNADGDLVMSADEITAINQRNDELTAMGKERDELVKLASIEGNLKNAEAPIMRSAIHPMPGTGSKAPESAKTIGEMFTASDAYTARQRMGTGPSSDLPVGIGDLRATLFETSAGWDPESLRIPGLVVPYATRPVRLIDIIPSAQTSYTDVKYMEETTFTNSAAERSEGGAYAESAFVLTERSMPIRSVGTSLPVTDEQLDDVLGIQSYLEGRLGFCVMQKLDSQIMSGDGNAPNISGILDATNLQTQAKGADPVPDAVYKAMTKVRVTGQAFPSAYVTHPTDWQDVRLLRTADGQYIWGNPSEAGPERIWGLQVVQTAAITENTGLVGDFSPAMLALYEKQGLDVQVGYVADNFKEGKRTVRAGVRVALAVYRGAAFCSVTSV